MTEQAFLDQLRKSLKGIPGSELKEIVSDYEEHFAVARSSGKMDDEIASSLGNPKTIGKSYRVDTAMKADRPGFKRILSAVFASVSLGFFNIVFVLGPFLALVAVLISLWAAALSVGLSGIAVILGIILQPILPAELSIAGVNIGFLIFAAIGATGLGFLGMIGMWQASKFFAKGTGKYLQFNAQFIRKRKEDIDE